MMRTGIVCFLVCIVCFSKAHGQVDSAADHDSAYYQSYRDQLTGRTYLSRKYTLLRFDPTRKTARFVYNPNTSLNLGVGATYHAFTLNIGIGISKFNPDGEKGKTRYLDLQGHFYAREWNFDLLGEFYRGYYLTPKGKAANAGESYYKRNDLNLDLMGLAVYRNLNKRHFSYQAGLLQNEWQKKSAGAFLAGAEVYYGSIHGDSSLAPSRLDSDYQKLDIDRLHFFEIGPGFGYAYTFVYREHFFVLASVSINLALRYSKEHSNLPGKYEDRIDFTPNDIIHAGIGYNSEKWSVSALWVSTRLNVKGEVSNYKYGVATGNYRLIVAKRFRVGHRVKKALQPIPDIMGK
jgi:hypothetical protein